MRRALHDGDLTPYARTGRLLSVAYGVAAVGLAAWIAWRTLGPATAALTALLAAASPVAIEFAQPLRSDSAATFYGLVYLLLVLRAAERPRLARQALAGAALGLAIASRYVMASTGLVLLVAQLGLLRDAARRRELLRGVVAAWLAVPAAFVAVTPYVLLTPRAAWKSFATGAANQAAHTGIESLGVTGNLAYYALDALPSALGWPQYLLALLGAGIAVATRRRATMLLALYVVSFVAGISLLGIHWQRWIVPVLPVLSVLAASAIIDVARLAARRTRTTTVASPVAIATAAVLAVLALAWPAREAVRTAERFSRPSTEVLMLDWILANLPDGSSIAYEWYSAPLDSRRARAKRFRLLAPAALAERTLESYRRDGWEYLVASSHLFARYTRHPARHPKEAAFYRRLWKVGRPVHKVAPGAGRRGPIVTLFRLPPDPAGASHATKRPGDAASPPP